MSMQPIQTQSTPGSQKNALNKRLEDIAWALFLIMIGGLWLMPGEQPEGVWLIGTGVILLGLNGIRYLNGIRTSSFGIVLGVLALIGGLASLRGLQLPLFAMLLVVIGVSIIVRPLFEKGS